MDMLRKLWDKYYEIITYVIVGVLTTAADYLVYYPMFYFVGVSALCKLVSMSVAIIFSISGESRLQVTAISVSCICSLICIVIFTCVPPFVLR